MIHKTKSKENNFKGEGIMNKEEMLLVVNTFTENFKEEVLKMCDGNRISVTVAALLGAAEILVKTAIEIIEPVDERKNAWDLIKGALKETRE